MFNLKMALSAVILSAGIASAASPTSVTSAITNVQMAPGYATGSSPYTETTPFFLVNISGTVYASLYNSDKTKAMYDLAKSAAAASKSVWLMYDTDNTITRYRCSEYSSSGCIQLSWDTYSVIQEMAIYP